MERDGHGSENDLLHHDEMGSGSVNGARSRRVSSEFDLWGRFSESRKSSYNNLVPLGENTTSNSSLNAYPTLPDNIYPLIPEVMFIDLLQINIARMSRSIIFHFYRHLVLMKVIT